MLLSWSCASCWWLCATVCWISLYFIGVFLLLFGCFDLWLSFETMKSLIVNVMKVNFQQGSILSVQDKVSNLTVGK